MFKTTAVIFIFFIFFFYSSDPYQVTAGSVWKVAELRILKFYCFA